MTVEEKYQTISVIIDDGTGVLFQPMTREYTYILTVKHNLQYEDDRQNWNDKNKDAIVIKNNFGTKINIEIINIYHHQSLDISIVKIKYLDITYLVNLSTNTLTDGIDFNLYGYPGTRRREELKSRLIKLKYNNQPNEDLIVMKNSEHSSQGEIRGYSGGGVFYEEDEELYLIGIQRKMDDESRQEESNNSLNIIPINKFFEIVETNSNELQGLYPPFVESFINFIDDAFLLNNMLSSKRIVQGILKNCILNKIKVCPSDFLERNEINVLKSNIKDSANNKILWIMYLEFLVFCNLIKEFDEFNMSSVDEIKNEFKFIFGKSKEWTSLIPLAMRSDLSSLTSGGTVFIACDGDCEPFRTHLVKDSLLNISQRPSHRDEWRIDEGIKNPYDELVFKHIFDFQKKIIENEGSFINLTEFDVNDIEGKIKDAVS
jgi:hypothetical protein